MAKPYKQLAFLERKRIEEGLDLGCSIRGIAADLGRSPSTVLREIRSNKVLRRNCKKTYIRCSKRFTCEVRALCGARCPYSGEKRCARCEERNCADLCPEQRKEALCPKIEGAPGVCNGCRHRSGKCRTKEQWVYLAGPADEAVRERRSRERRGIDMDQESAIVALERIREGILRGMSPYEIAQAYEGEIDVSRSTIYRWVDKGYGQLASIELERKVGFKRRSHKASRKPTKHSSCRSYEAHLRLPEDLRCARWEMDTMIGAGYADKAILTLYHVPSHLQLALLMEAKIQSEVERNLKLIRKICGKAFFEELFSVVLTDNGSEFAGEYKLGRIFGERPDERKRLFYCDVRASNQKGSCEKNHTELRQILRQRIVDFDDLCERDVSCVVSHANSNPRASLCGMSPIALFKAMFEEKGIALLDGLGVREVPRDEIMLKPQVINKERLERGEDPIDIKS